MSERKICPECRDGGKHRNCTHVSDIEPDGATVDCACGCVESRTCPNCQDVVPVGWTLDDHLNCHWPEDHQ